MGKYVAVRGEHQGGIFAEDFVISLQGLEEDVELRGLRALRIGTGVNLRRLGISLATDLLHSAVSVGLDFVQVALALACDARGFTLTLGTKALCNLESLADHALVDAVQDIGVVVDSLDPEIEHGNAEPRQFLRSSGLNFLFDLLPSELNGWEDADGAGGVAFETFVVQRLPVLVGAHDFDKIVFGDGVARANPKALRDIDSTCTVASLRFQLVKYVSRCAFVNSAWERRKNKRRKSES